jgi:exo-beta-1,3-glucanase (GH17 family)
MNNDVAPSKAGARGMKALDSGVRRNDGQRQSPQDVTTTLSAMARISVVPAKAGIQNGS